MYSCYCNAIIIVAMLAVAMMAKICPSCCCLVVPLKIAAMYILTPAAAIIIVAILAVAMMAKICPSCSCLVGHL